MSFQVAKVDKFAEPKKKTRKLIKDEHRETGGVKWSIYDTYLKTLSYRTRSILACLIVCAQGLGVTEKLWIRKWSEPYQHVAQSAPFIITSSLLTENEVLMSGYMPSRDYQHYWNSYFHVDSPAFLSFMLPDVHERPMFYAGVYALIGFASATVSVLATATQYAGALKASRSIFRKLLSGVLRATMRWHDITPAGRMLNRFGKDVETIDTNLASSLSTVNSSLATFSAAIIIVAVFFPIFLLPVTFIGFFYYILAIGYPKTGRDLRRMESNSWSPIFSGFGELLEGIATVQEFSAEQRLSTCMARSTLQLRCSIISG